VVAESLFYVIMYRSYELLKIGLFWPILYIITTELICYFCSYKTSLQEHRWFRFWWLSSPRPLQLSEPPSILICFRSLAASIFWPVVTQLCTCTFSWSLTSLQNVWRLFLGDNVRQLTGKSLESV